MSVEQFKKIILGDEKAFEEVFMMHFKSMCFYAKLFGLSLEQSKEIVQLTFLKFWELRSQLDPAARVENYLYKAIRNNCLNYLRKQKVQLNYIDPSMNLSTLDNVVDMQEHGHESMIYDELEQKFLLAMENFPPQMRKIFILSRYDGLKYREIAEKLNISVKTVETQMSRALTKLRVDLKEYLPFLLFLFPKFFS